SDPGGTSLPSDGTPSSRRRRLHCAPRRALRSNRAWPFLRSSLGSPAQHGPTSVRRRRLSPKTALHVPIDSADQEKALVTEAFASRAPGETPSRLGAPPAGFTPA